MIETDYFMQKEGVNKIKDRGIKWEPNGVGNC